MRAEEIIPKLLHQELLRLARMDRNWLRWVDLGGNRYKAECKFRTWLTSLFTTGADAFSMWAMSICLVDGPKVFAPTQEQCDALAHVELRIMLSDYQQPYDCMVVRFPQPIGPFKFVICHRSEQMLTCVLISGDNRNDITTTVAVDGRPMEASVIKFDADCAELGEVAALALRIAINSCLVLVDHDCETRWLRPKDVESDARLAREATPRGERARERLALATSVLTFKQEVRLHDSERMSRQPGEPTGAEMPPHWRRGHWRMQPHGERNTLRKRILIKPVLVRGDRFLGERSDTCVTYNA